MLEKNVCIRDLRKAVVSDQCNGLRYFIYLLKMIASNLFFISYFIEIINNHPY
jgi:hypothetical protein